MDKTLELKLKGMLWDLPFEKRETLIQQIIINPEKAFRDEQLLIRGLNSLNWYDLIQVFGYSKLLDVLSESTIDKLYPLQRQVYYKNAKRLLSKYTLSSAG